MDPKETAEAFVQAAIDQSRDQAEEVTQLTWLDVHGPEDLDRYLDVLREEASPTGWVEVLRVERPEKLAHTVRDVFVRVGTQAIRLRLVCELGPYQDSLEGQWGVVPASVRPAETTT